MIQIPHSLKLSMGTHMFAGGPCVPRWTIRLFFILLLLYYFHSYMSSSDAIGHQFYFSKAHFSENTVEVEFIHSHNKSLFGGKELADKRLDINALPENPKLRAAQFFQSSSVLHEL